MKESPENKKGMLHRGRHSIDTCERIIKIFTHIKLLI
nr:MAG TPA: hypothetical protein [Caudoviricetes sp.]